MCQGLGGIVMSGVDKELIKLIYQAVDRVLCLERNFFKPSICHGRSELPLSFI